MRVGGKIAGHFFPRIRHEAGVRGVVAALREVATQAGLKVSSGVVLRVALFVGAAACQVIPPNELEYVFGKRVEWDHQIGGVASDGLKKGLEGWCADAPTIQKKSTDRVRIDRQTLCQDRQTDRSTSNFMRAAWIRTDTARYMGSVHGLGM